ncbi:response regulator transcription factor [Thermodesulfobacteriota bacterium]
MSEEKKKILLIEDEETISVGICDMLESSGYSVEWVSDGRSGLSRGLDGDSDLILLDIMLPFLDGFEIAKQLRENDIETPIIMLTAKGSEDDKLKGLSIAADDYITKPFSIKELLARIKAVLRRSKNVSNIVNLNDMVINFSRFELKKGDELIELTTKEAQILKYFIEHKEKIITREELLENVWGYKSAKDVETRTVDIYIVKLRGKIEKDHNTPQIITTVRSKGYKFDGTIR